MARQRHRRTEHHDPPYLRLMLSPAVQATIRVIVVVVVVGHHFRAFL
jgi:hypothetical protein